MCLLSFDHIFLVLFTEVGLFARYPGVGLACEQALWCGVVGWREEERELAIMSHKFDFLCPKSGREMLIG